MGDARGGAKRADPKDGALNHAWVYLLRTRGVMCRSQYKNIHTYTQTATKLAPPGPEDSRATLGGMDHGTVMARVHVEFGQQVVTQ